MKPKTTFVALLLGTALALAPAAGAKVVLDGGNSGGTTGVTTFKPSAMTAAEYRALVIRGTALNAIYGSHSAATPSGMTPAEYHALVVRSEALNALYGNAQTALTPQQFKQQFERAVAQSSHVSASGTASTSSTFDWSEALIVAAAAMLLTLAFVGVTRRRHHRLGV